MWTFFNLHPHHYPPMSDFNDVADFGRGFWLRERKLSGKQIDFIRGQNIPHNAKSIDRTIGLSCVVSHKSTDLRLNSYRSPKTVYRIGMKFVRHLKDYQGEVRCDHKIKATYHLHWALEGCDTLRVLEWFIPAARVTSAQEASLIRVVKDASECGVSVKIVRVRD